MMTAKQLSRLSREQLLALLTELLEEAPELGDWIAAALAVPAAPARSKASAPKRQKVDTGAYRRRVRGIMHSLDHLRASEAYWQVGGLADELRGVEKEALEFLNAGDAETALRILLELLAESHDGFDYIDDSNGELGDFLSGLGATLAEVILSLDLDEEEREDLLSDLDELHTQLSNYGVDGLEVAVAAAEHGWGELPGTASASAEKVAKDQVWEEDEEDEEAFTFRAPHEMSLAQQLTRAKLNVLERQGRTDEYLALCLKTGEHLRYALQLVALDRVPAAVAHALKHLRVADEALKLAERLREADHLSEAIKIGEHGLRLGGSKAALGDWLGRLEEAQGRIPQALAAWVAAFRSASSLATWQTIKRLAARRWNKLQPELMASLKTSGDDHALAEVLLHEQEWDAAAKVADKNAYSYHLVALVADALVAQRPDWVIRASRKQAEELIVKTKSKYYVHAANWLRRVKAAFAQQGQTGEWQKYLQQLKEQYRRRPALMAHLNRL